MAGSYVNTGSWAPNVYSSWGRTRQPKNIAGVPGTQALTVDAGTPSAATNGYKTEGQRYLHMYLDTSTSGQNRTVTVWGYYHAFGVWSALKDTSGTAVTIAKSNGVEQKVFEIAGIDRVYFSIGGALHATDEFFAAMSTFWEK